MSSVYFIQAESGPIKIGCSSNLRHRLASLRVASREPLRLLGYVDGDVGLESRLHAEFAGGCIRGEWFNPTPALMARIEGLLASGVRGLPDVPSTKSRFSSHAEGSWASRIDMEALSGFLRAWFPARTAESVSEKIGVPPSTVRKWLSGEVKPSSTAMLALICARGPDIIKTLVADAPDWVDHAAREHELAIERATLAATREKIERLERA